jgi:hypothetical protein
MLVMAVYMFALFFKLKPLSLLRRPRTTITTMTTSTGLAAGIE